MVKNKKRAVLKQMVSHRACVANRMKHSKNIKYFSPFNLTEKNLFDNPQVRKEIPTVGLFFP